MSKTRLGNFGARNFGILNGATGSFGRGGALMRTVTGSLVLRGRRVRAGTRGVPAVFGGMSDIHNPFVRAPIRGAWAARYLHLSGAHTRVSVSWAKRFRTTDGLPPAAELTTGRNLSVAGIGTSSVLRKSFTNGR